MIETSDNRDEIIRKYLLNELTETEREEIEDEMILDEDLFDRAQVTEMNLIESYVLGEMSSAEKTRFEEKFLVSSENQNKVREAQLFHQALQKLHKERVPEKNPTMGEKVKKWTATFFEIPKWSFAAASLLILSAIGVGILIIIFVRQTPLAPVANENRDNINTNVEANKNQNNENIPLANNNPTNPIKIEPTPKPTLTPHKDEVAQSAPYTVNGGDKVNVQGQQNKKPLSVTNKTENVPLTFVVREERLKARSGEDVVVRILKPDGEIGYRMKRKLKKVMTERIPASFFPRSGIYSFLVDESNGKPVDSGLFYVKRERN